MSAEGWTINKNSLVFLTSWYPSAFNDVCLDIAFNSLQYCVCLSASEGRNAETSRNIISMDMCGKRREPF
jgi:hypothetical protein